MQFPKKTDFVEKQKESILANLEVKSSVLAAKVNEKLTKAVKLPVVVYFDKEHIIPRSSPAYELPGQLEAIVQYVTDALVKNGWSVEFVDEEARNCGFHPGMGGGDGPSYSLTIR